MLLARFSGSYRRGFLSERHEVYLKLFSDHVEGEGFILKNNEISGNMVRYRIMLNDILDTCSLATGGIHGLQIQFEHRMNGQDSRETLLLPGLLEVEKASADIIHARGLFCRQLCEPVEEEKAESEQEKYLKYGSELGMPGLGTVNLAGIGVEQDHLVPESGRSAGEEGEDSKPDNERFCREEALREAALSLEIFKIRVEKLRHMRDHELLTDGEFEEEKKRLLSDI